MRQSTRYTNTATAVPVQARQVDSATTAGHKGPPPTSLGHHSAPRLGLLIDEAFKISEEMSKVAADLANKGGPTVLTSDLFARHASRCAWLAASLPSRRRPATQ
jgi:hypothetical protein